MLVDGLLTAAAEFRCVPAQVSRLHRVLVTGTLAADLLTGGAARDDVEIGEKDFRGTRGAEAGIR